MTLEAGLLNATGVPSIFGEDTIGINSISLSAQTVAQINDFVYWVGVVGLHTWDEASAAENKDRTDLITALKNNAEVPSRTFGYTGGAPYGMFQVVDCCTQC